MNLSASLVGLTFLTSSMKWDTRPVASRASIASLLLVSLGVLKWNEWEDTIHMNNDNLEAILANPWTNSPHKKHKLEYFTFTSLAHNTS